MSNDEALERLENSNLIENKGFIKTNDYQPPTHRPNDHFPLTHRSTDPLPTDSSTCVINLR